MITGKMSDATHIFFRLSLNALLTIAVHNRDIVFDLLDGDICRADDFEWKRFVCHVCMCVTSLM